MRYLALVIALFALMGPGACPGGAGGDSLSATSDSTPDDTDLADTDSDDLGDPGTDSILDDTGLDNTDLGASGDVDKTGAETIATAYPIADGIGPKGDRGQVERRKTHFRVRTLDKPAQFVTASRNGHLIISYGKAFMREFIVGAPFRDST